MENHTFTRRDALKVGVLGTAALTLPFLPGPLAAKRAGELKEDELPRPYATPFVRPPEAAPTGTVTVAGQVRPLYVLEQRPFTASIVPGYQTTMWGYNGTFPGPTVRATRGTPIAVRQINRLPARHPTLRYESSTSTHLHGAPSLPQYDGYANDLMLPGQFKDYLYDNLEEERTLWYHDHAVHHTTENVYMGLAGMYITRNPVDGQLPSGQYDVPLVISDAAFTKSGQLLFEDHSESGLAGDVILVNGRPWPLMQVERRQYRFRILIASLGRAYKLQLSPAAPMTVVATDGGLVPEPQPVTTLTAGMAERYEIVIDFANYRVGQRVELRNLGVKNAIDYDHTNKVMAFQVVAEASVPDAPIALPRLAEPVPETPLMELQAGDAVRTRQLRFERQGGEWTIDRKTWADVEKSGFQDVLGNPQPGDVEVWELQNNSGGWFHPIHVHLVDFKILDRDGKPPEPYERGPKDVVYLGENETVRIIARFGGALIPGPDQDPIRRTGRYMIHCHNTSHEDHDMMFQFRVGADTPENDPLGVPPQPLPGAGGPTPSPSPTPSSSPSPSPTPSAPSTGSATRTPPRRGSQSTPTPTPTTPPAATTTPPRRR